MGAIAYSLDVSRNDVKKMAIGLGDNNIKIWTIPISADGFDAHVHAGNVYASENVWKGLKGKITKVYTNYQWRCGHCIYSDVFCSGQVASNQRRFIDIRH